MTEHTVTTIYSGDEWALLGYRGYEFKEIGVGASGYYLDGHYLGYTLEEAKRVLDCRAWARGAYKSK